MNLQYYTFWVFTVSLWLLQISPAKHDGLSQPVPLDNPLSAAHNIWSLCASASLFVYVCVCVCLCVCVKMTKKDSSTETLRWEINSRWKTNTQPFCPMNKISKQTEFLKDFHSDVSVLLHHFNFGLWVHLGNPPHVKTSPVLTVQYSTTFGLYLCSPLPSAAAEMNKRFPALPTVMSVMPFDSTYDVLTEVFSMFKDSSCLWLKYVWVSDTLSLAITSCNNQSVAGWAATFVSHLYPSESNPCLAIPSHRALCEFVCVHVKTIISHIWS